MIYITGDTHGVLDINKLEKLKNLNKDDYIIILGDFGYPSFVSTHDIKIKEYYSKFRCKILFIDGNHENFEKLNSYKIENWKSGKVQFISDNIIHLMRGEIYNIDGHTILTCGGAFSIDYYIRTLGYDYFLEENLTQREFNYMLNNLEKHNNKVDYILTHTPCEYVMQLLYGDRHYINDSTSKALNYLCDNIEYKRWFSGHCHMDTEIYGYKQTILYDTIYKLECVK